MTDLGYVVIERRAGDHGVIVCLARCDFFATHLHDRLSDAERAADRQRHEHPGRVYTIARLVEDDEEETDA